MSESRSYRRIVVLKIKVAKTLDVNVPGICCSMDGDPEE